MKDPRQKDVRESTVVLVCRDIELDGEDRKEIERSEAALAHVFPKIHRIEWTVTAQAAAGSSGRGARASARAGRRFRRPGVREGCADRAFQGGDHEAAGPEAKPGRRRPSGRGATRRRVSPPATGTDRGLRTGSASRRFLRVPIPSISTSTTSPTASQRGGVRAKPTPLGVPVAMMSPGLRETERSFEQYSMMRCTSKH